MVERSAPLPQCDPQPMPAIDGAVAAPDRGDQAAAAQHSDGSLGAALPTGYMRALAPAPAPAAARAD
ncbi:hypothetical protein, partial [Blastomonas sp.]|uniref:hypothetical protein n=1 Tax=Blastomonas sp. TaxID=1909299 RepID=UPI003592E9C2